MNRVAYIISGSGRISGSFNGKPFSIETDNPSYGLIVDALVNEDFDDFESLLNTALAVVKYSHGNVVVDGNCVLYKGQEVHNTVVNKILDFMTRKLPYKPLLKFLDNLMDNPSMASRNELYDFLENGGFPITENGNFLAYKGLRADYYDIHSGKFLNSVGSTHKMERKDVDDDRRNQCSYGFHVGSYEYARDFSKGALVMVEVNPKDVVSVPQDYNCQKCRVTEYTVVQDCEGKLEDPYVGDVECDYEDDYFEDDSEY